MTVQAPRHAKRLHLPYLQHLIHPPMAGDAAYTGGDMRLVIEVNIVREAMHLHPRNRFAPRIALADKLKLHALGLDPRMTVHAHFCGRDGCICRFLYSEVAVAAIHAQVSRVQFMTVRHWLNRRVSRIEHSRLRKIGVQPSNCACQKHQSARGQTHHTICGSRKNGAHPSLLQPL